MIFIDVEHKKPTDTNIPGWIPWTKAQWDDWLAKSKKLVTEMAEQLRHGSHSASAEGEP